MKVKDFIEKLSKKEHLDKEIIISSDEEGNRYFSDINFNGKFRHILIIYSLDGSEVELDDYLWGRENDKNRLWGGMEGIKK